MTSQAAALPTTLAGEETTAAPPGVPGSRIASVDLLRGAIMVLMVVDHVRVFSAVPPGGPDPAVFFTRWVTHFCAPGFIFFAGTAAFLHGRKLQSRGAVARWLAVRGLWLIVLELTLMRLSWTFNLDFQHYLLAGVLWVIGWCMIALAGLVFLPTPVAGAVGVAIILLHNLMDPHVRPAIESLQGSSTAWVWQVLYLGGSVGPLTILYTLIPWVGVIAAGWAFGAVLLEPPERRRRLCLGIGIGAIGGFVLLRATSVYGDPRPFLASAKGPMPALLRFLNTSKYPASLQFLLMTLGPLIAAIPLVERLRGPVARVLVVFGRVPLFFYVLHIPLIHALALLVSRIREGHVNPWLFENHPMGMPQAPPGSMWSLPLLYLVALVAVMLLYVPCRWLADLKLRSRSWWLSLV